MACRLNSFYVHVVAVDMNPAENALLELKIAAIKQLDYEDYLVVLGEKEDTVQRRLVSEMHTVCVEKGRMGQSI